MTGGDRFDIDIKVGAGARLSVTTAAAEKIYRSLGPDTDIGVKLDVGPGGALAWLPQETIVFDQARLRRSIDIALARDANLLLAEAAVFGRSAMGETVVQGHFFDRWRLRVGGALVFAETLRLDGDIAQRLAQRAITGGGVAVASVIKYPGNDADAVAVRAMQDHFAGEVGVSAWNGLVVARLVATRRRRAAPRSRCRAHRARCRAVAAAVAELKGRHAAHPARERQAADRHGGDGGAAAARARRQAQPSRSGRADLRFHRRRRARRAHASPN